MTVMTPKPLAVAVSPSRPPRVHTGNPRSPGGQVFGGDRRISDITKQP
jgi:hypothetical protein